MSNTGSSKSWKLSRMLKMQLLPKQRRQSQMSPWKDWISETVIAKLQKKVALAGPAMNRRYDMKCLLFLESFKMNYTMDRIENILIYFDQFQTNSFSQESARSKKSTQSQGSRDGNKSLSPPSYGQTMRSQLDPRIYSATTTVIISLNL